MLAATVVASLSLGTPGAVASGCPGAELVPGASSIGVARGATLCLLNEQRSAAGLAGLASEGLLTSVATQYSQSMVDGRFFAHVSPSGQGLQQRLAGYLESAGGWAIGENLAWGEDAGATPATIVDGWMHSAPHRANIFDPAFREIGIGIVNGSPHGSAPASSATYTTDFGRRDSGGDSSAGSSPSPASVSGASVPAGGQAAAAPRSAPTDAGKPAKRLSAAGKRRIRTRCARTARRTHASLKAHTKAVARCVRVRTRAASKRA